MGRWQLKLKGRHEIYSFFAGFPKGEVGLLKAPYGWVKCHGKYKNSMITLSISSSILDSHLDKRELLKVFE